ncbi:unnamed protein product [Parnassius apollo]|uniref:(apollo) hypothetical protein n=1 Tax=Parnassius apollo TaxID=110799 RepID=A0A8S3XGG7_PARAO|nr:unnamed protein product [Parnassius apollo]
MTELSKSITYARSSTISETNELRSNLSDISSSEGSSRSYSPLPDLTIERTTDDTTFKTSSNNTSALNEGAMSPDLNESESSDLDFELQPLFKINQSERNNQDSNSSNFTVVVTDDSGEIETTRRDKCDVATVMAFAAFDSAAKKGHKADLAKKLTTSKFSALTDETTDVSTIKTDCIVVRYSDNDAQKICSVFWELYKIFK